MARIILTDKTGERFVVETTTMDYREAIDPTGTAWTTTDDRHWESEDGEEATR